MASLDRLRTEFTAALLQSGRQWRKIAEQALEAHGISEATALPLVWIARLGGGVRQVKLAAYVGIEGPSLVRLLDQLVEDKLVVRKDDPDDRRAKNVCLTKAGEHLAKKIETTLMRERARLLADIPERDLEAALRVMRVFGTAETRLAKISAGRTLPGETSA